MKQNLTPSNGVNPTESIVSLAIVKEYRKEHKLHYKIEYVAIEQEQETKLHDQIISRLNMKSCFYKYLPDNQGSVEDKKVNFESIDFFRILDALLMLDPEENKFETIDSLVRAKSYILILRNQGEIEAASFKAIPEQWKFKNTKELVPLLLKGSTVDKLKPDSYFSTTDF